MHIRNMLGPMLAGGLVLAGSGCREGDGPLTPNGGARVFVVSDPAGAPIFVDNQSTGLRTPDTLRGLGGRHDISVRLDTVQATYGFTTRVFLTEADSAIRIEGPLVNRCAEPVCYNAQFRYYAANRVRFASNPVGNLFLRGGTGGDGLIWPSLSNNSYASGSMVGFAGILGNDTVSIGIYDHSYLAGRPVPTVVQMPDRIELTQATWIVPPSANLQRATVRGLEIVEHVVATTSTDDVLVIRLTFRNITNQPLYAALDPTVPPAGRTFENAWLGFVFDPDIGTSNDDALSYELPLDLVYAYDARFDENIFGEGFGRAPGLIGLRMIEKPAGTTTILNGWLSAGVLGAQDWLSGTATERNGWGMLSGMRSFNPDHPDPRIGHVPPPNGDVRISVSAGPVRLAPGDSASVTIALILAAPVPDTFTSGNILDPGEPTDQTRALRDVAADLFAKAAAVTPPTARRAQRPGGTVRVRK
jgi:hypothetical protein